MFVLVWIVPASQRPTEQPSEYSALQILFESGVWQYDTKSCIRETLNLWTCVDSSTNTYVLLLFSYSYFFSSSGVRCQVSGVRCRVSPVSWHLSHVTNANSHINGPSLCKLPQYPQQDAAADLDLDSSTRSCENPKITLFFCAGIF